MYIDLQDQIDNDFFHSIIGIKRLSYKKEFLYNSLFNIKKVIKDNQDNKQGLVIVIEKFISDNIGNQDLSLTLIADYINRNPTYVSIVYKEQTGNNLSDYIAKLRIKKAKNLLETN